MLPGLIDQQQTGFIAGRNIVENILSLRMAQEWVPVSNQEIMFVKLDFQKAYDRVSHSYLWDTLSAMGLTQENLNRIQGLVTDGAAQLHINGKFTRRFEVTRGVRQGCPVAPLLFAMVTQPLMRVLREEEKCGRLKGVTYGGEQTLLHQIYADDTGVNTTMAESQFNRLREVIADFEEISGAKLNLSKSLIMPIRPTTPPEWVQATGCDVAYTGRNFLYLGVSTSNPVNEAEITKQISKKVVKRLTHWSNRLLSWPARVILLRHVLASTPLYQLLSVGVEQKGLEGIEALCRHFLWGWQKQENPKAALVAWERIAQGREAGGLGWTPLIVKAKALQLRNLMKIMAGANAEWCSLAKSLVLRTLRRKAWIWRYIQRGYFIGNRGKGWSVERRLCPRCNIEEETLDHAFWSCSRVQRRKIELTRCGLLPTGILSSMEWLNHGLRLAARDTSSLWCFGLYLTTTWAERNDCKFRGTRSFRPTLVFLRQLNLEIEAFVSPQASNRTYNISKTARERIQQGILTWIGSRQTQPNSTAPGEEDYNTKVDSNTHEDRSNTDGIHSTASSSSSGTSMSGPTLQQDEQEESNGG
ncbi:hypothetical protein R1sor_002989 [Riccia sorocarpa]|uniref:Reverse transcriptase domain-containing protein n=1 Tax=Riccia sorocarpa TaxID=122646 RepID=A0ABD3H3E8_9MARC